MTRTEDIAATNPAGAEVLVLELGADDSGQLTGIRARVFVDRGSTDDFGVESIAAMLAAGPYRWSAHELTALGIATNRVTFGAYRAPAAPPAAFAVESLLDELARRLEIDPLELRLRNVAVEGDRAPSGQPFPIFGARQCLERVRDHPLWAQRDQLPDGEGIGIALGWWPGGYEPAAAACRLDADGRLTIVTGAADMTGVETGFAVIAAEAFGVDPARVRVVNADTSSAPYAGTSGGSKVTYTVGRAVERAATEARQRLLEVAAEELEIAPDDLEIVDGAVQPAGVPARALPIDELAPKILRFGSPHPLEELAHDGYGQLTTGTFVDYALPTASIVPSIDTEIVEVPVPEGPYGAKGVGEAPVVGVPGAVANAIAAATGGARMRQLPMTPERVWRALAAGVALEAH